MVSVTVGDCAVDKFQMSSTGVIAVRKGQVNSSLEARMEVLMPEPQIYVERTLAIIKPDVIGKEEEIEDLILRSGFQIIQAAETWKGFAVALQAVISLVFSLRALYGTDELRNGLHGSLSISSAEKEIRFIFPEAILEPVPTGQRARDYLNLYVKPTLLAGLTALCKEKPADPMIWLADWLIEHNPNKPKLQYRISQ
ncbi:nucleoside diphosphate kinase homolog 5 isoform X2 [Anomalospiza imberbis]|uniref:nucleoside diphosphate kinase homolog 5 isoform X2 n=1 Tax=Anomalospiza imberbis TaxID=187417 RepID=UPI00358E24F7